MFVKCPSARPRCACGRALDRSEEHTSELQSRSDLVCRLLLEKKNRREVFRFDRHASSSCIGGKKNLFVQNRAPSERFVSRARVHPTTSRVTKALKTL